MASSLAVACLVAATAPGYGQSLEEVARKERERRERARQTSSPAPIVGADELASNKGSVANDTKAATAPAARDKKTPDTGAPRPASRPGTNPEQYWRARAVAARQRIEEAERRAFAIQRMIHLGSEHYAENGRIVIYSRETLKQMADAADAEVVASKQGVEDLLDEARRAGAQPGWLR
jgi:hypothetical protein